jgi:hypothetical protein
MSRQRSSLARLSAFVLIVGLMFACLKNPSIILASAVFTLTTGVLLAGILCVAYHEPPRRYFWLGFAVFGLGHQFVACWLPWSPDRQPILLTSHLYALCREIVLFGYVSFESHLWGMTLTRLDGALSWQMAQSFFSLLVAYVAGLVTQFVFVRRDGRRTRSEELS